MKTTPPAPARSTLHQRARIAMAAGATALALALAGCQAPGTGAEGAPGNPATGQAGGSTAGEAAASGTAGGTAGDPTGGAPDVTAPPAPGSAASGAAKPATPPTAKPKPAKSDKPRADTRPTSGGGRYVRINEDYSTNRAGLADRFFTGSEGAQLFRSIGGALIAGDLPANSVAYRDVAYERAGGQRRGWYFVRTQGMTGWMKEAALVRESTAPTSNAAGLTRAQVRAQPNGRLPSGSLVAIPWDSERTLLAAPALADLTRLNAAFQARFGRPLQIDLAYRTRQTQDYLFKELGPNLAAIPGTSNHGWGDAIDVPETPEYAFGGKYYLWLKANAGTYNWIHRRNLEEFTVSGARNPNAEAWHFEYLGGEGTASPHPAPLRLLNNPSRWCILVRIHHRDGGHT